MTRDDLISILSAKKFNCMNDMAEYFEERGFEVNIEDANWECLFVTFVNSTDKLEFSSMYDPWLNTWSVFVIDLDNLAESADEIKLR